MSGECILNPDGERITDSDGAERVSATGECGPGCGCGGGGACWFYASPCCGDDGTVCLAYPCSEPSLFDVESDPPQPAVFIWQGLPGRCFSLSPTPYPDLLAGCTPITFAEIVAQPPACDDPACGPPCSPKAYKALIPCCPKIGNVQPPVLYIDCDQAFLQTLGAGAVEIGDQCYVIHDFNCDSFTSPPANYLPGPYSGYTIHQDCRHCCPSPPPPPAECPQDCTTCADTYNVTIPPISCFVPSSDWDCCVDPPDCGGAQGGCQIGSCLYEEPGVVIPVSKPPGQHAVCNWSGQKTFQRKRTGCCVGPHPGSFVFEDITRFVNSLGCTGTDDQGHLIYTLTLEGAVYQRLALFDGCPAGTYQKITPYKVPADCANGQPAINPDACRWPNEVVVG